MKSTVWGGRGVLRITRREFLRKSGALAVGLGLGSALSACAARVAGTMKPGGHADETGANQPNAARLGWRVSVQGWAYRSFPLFEALGKAAALGLGCYEVRTILNLDANRPNVKADENMPDDARKELRVRLADLGISVPSVYSDFDGKPDQARRLFEFWKGLGTDIVVVEPPGGSLDMLEKLCEEYDMRLAIHNHQKGQSPYWSPERVLEDCANRSTRIGACCDGGQWVRSDMDPVECLRKMEGRILAFHLKDVLKKGDLNSRNTIFGEGEGNCAGQLEELKRQGFRGLITIDYEHSTPALQQDMARNIAFVEEQAARLLAG